MRALPAHTMLSTVSSARSPTPLGIMPPSVSSMSTVSAFLAASEVPLAMACALAAVAAARLLAAAVACFPACERVRWHIIRNERVENVGKSQSCMVFQDGLKAKASKATKRAKEKGAAGVSKAYKEGSQVILETMHD